jgi:hypothetical protein
MFYEFIACRVLGVVTRGRIGCRYSEIMASCSRSHLQFTSMYLSQLHSQSSGVRVVCS